MIDQDSQVLLLKSSRAKFVVFEGLDGSGTSTQLNLLEQWLRSQGADVDTTFEPSEGPLGGIARQAISSRQPLDAVSLSLCLAADRVDHVENDFAGINRSLRAGRWVLCDRYKLSSLAYQASQGVDVGWLVVINRQARDPDLTIFIDTPPAVCLQRLQRRSSRRDIFDDVRKLETILDNYLKVIEERGVGGFLIAVDGDMVPEDVFAQILDQFTKYLRSDTTRSASSDPQSTSSL